MAPPVLLPYPSPSFVPVLLIPFSLVCFLAFCLMTWRLDPGIFAHPRRPRARPPSPAPPAGPFCTLPSSFSRSAPPNTPHAPTLVSPCTSYFRQSLEPQPPWSAPAPLGVQIWPTLLHFRQRMAMTRHLSRWSPALLFSERVFFLFFCLVLASWWACLFPFCCRRPRGAFPATCWLFRPLFGLATPLWTLLRLSSLPLFPSFSD